MDKDPLSRPLDANAADASEAINDRPAMLESLYAQANAAQWMLSPGQFAAALKRSAQKALAPMAATAERLEQYLQALHLEDLALATACSSGIEAAWEHFIATYRTYLRSAAAAILRCKQGSAEASDLADSLFSELYGLADGKTEERSLFRYFHGRSSLKTWLRAVLAQRHIDSIRAGRRFEELAEDETGDGQGKTLLGPQLQPSDPHRERYVALFTGALQSALELLEPRERERLRLYYAEEKTLAEIGRLLGEHESSVSRHLDPSGPCSARFAAVGRRNPSPRYCHIERFRGSAGIERCGDRSLFRIQRRRHAH